MASKSKKRRRVFRASCILAALIIAGSSFAWFTSKDEVTNRLSASGDYDVSIVESFAPPAKWVPGQAVNKDVYAVNTGSVDAFVKESVSSVLTVVTEDAYTTGNSKPDAESNELSAAERYVVEAGAFLAYAPVGSKFTYNATDVDGTNVKTEDVGKVKSGMKAIAMNPDFDDENGYAAANATDFQPDVEGLYIFRRTIGVDPKTQIENYTYDAYYYVPSTGATTKQVQLEGTGANAGKFAWQASGNNNDPANYEWKLPSETPTSGYVEVMVDAPVDGVDEYFYKVSNLAVTPEKATFAGDLDQRDGMVATGGTYNSSTDEYNIDSTVAPTYGFYKDVTKTVVPTLTYDKLNNRLVASYNTGKTVDDTTLRGLATAYEDAAINYQDALEEYAAALGDELGRTYPNTLGGTELALQSATANLRTAVDGLLAAQYAEAAAKKAYDDAYDEMLVLKAKKEAAAEELANANTALGTQGAGAYNPSTGENDTLWGHYLYTEAALGESTAPDDGSNTSAWGNENTAKKARNDAKATYEEKKALREAATPDERNAFLDLVVPHVTPSIPSGDTPEQKRAKAITYLNDLTYQQMVGLNIVNPGDTGYSYYSKLIDEKSAKDALDTAEATYEQRIRERKEAQRDYDIAKAAKEAAEASLGTGAAATAVYNPATGENNTANGRFNYAKQQYEDKMEELYGTNHVTDGDEDHYDNDNTCLCDVWKDAITATANAQNNKNDKQGLYDDALAASGVAATNVKNAAERVAQTKQARDNAWTAYDTAYKSTTGELKININLADVVTEGGVADKWQLLPESLEDNYKNEVNATTGINEITKATDSKTDTASFYYTSVLGGGETSAKLIDSVELDSSVTQDMFKYFDFDLNITLNSAQVNIDENGNYTAETAQTELGKYAILSTPANADSTITWSDTETLPASAKAKTYKGSFKDGNDAAVAANKTGPITELTTPQIFDYEDYKYVVTVDGNTYYGQEIDSGKKFYKYDPATGTLLKENTTTVKDNVLTLAGAATQIFKVTITFKDFNETAEDKTADYTYTDGTWTGTAPAGTTFSSTKDGSYAADIASALTAPTEDGVATVWYKTV